MKIRKEAIMATIIGLIIGLLITGGVLRAQRAINSRETPDDPKRESQESKAITDDENSSDLTLEISEPEDNLVVSSPSITISGNTNEDTYIAIIAERNEYLIVPNEVGQFAQEVTLISGANTITITVYNESGMKVEKTLNLVYTSAEI